MAEVELSARAAAIAVTAPDGAYLWFLLIMGDQLCSQRNGCVIIDGASPRNGEWELIDRGV